MDAEQSRDKAGKKKKINDDKKPATSNIAQRNSTRR